MANSNPFGVSACRVRSPNYTFTSEPDICVFAFSLLLLLFEYIGLYGMNAHFLIFFSCYICRHCGICSEIWIMYCTHFNKKRIFPNAVCQSAGMAFFSLFLFALNLHRHNVIARNMAFCVWIDGMSLNFAGFAVMRGMCVRQCCL